MWTVCLGNITKYKWEYEAKYTQYSTFNNCYLLSAQANYK